MLSYKSLTISVKTAAGCLKRKPLGFFFIFYFSPLGSTESQMEKEKNKWIKLSEDILSNSWNSDIFSNIRDGAEQQGKVCRGFNQPRWNCFLLSRLLSCHLQYGIVLYYDLYVLDTFTLSQEHSTPPQSCSFSFCSIGRLFVLVSHQLERDATWFCVFPVQSKRISVCSRSLPFSTSFFFVTAWVMEIIEVQQTSPVFVFCPPACLYLSLTPPLFVFFRSDTLRLFFAWSIIFFCATARVASKLIFGL